MKTELKKDPVYLLTHFQHIPIIIKCEKEGDVDKFWTTKARILGKPCVDQNVKSGNWVAETNSQKIADIINANLTQYDCWIPKEDAFI